MWLDDVAAELQTSGLEAFRARYGRHFLVISEGDAIEDAAGFVDTASRTGAEVLQGRKDRIELRPLAGTRVTVGRDSACDIIIKLQRVSSLHAVFTNAGGLLLLADAGSKNGTRVNGTSLEKNKPVPVDAGDVIELGPARATIWGIDDVAAAAR